MKKPFVISISGISGSGKTTIANALKKRVANTEVINFDNISGDLPGQDYCEWSESGADCNEWILTPIIDEIERLCSDPLEYIVLDYPFGTAHRKVGAYVDISVWIDIPLDISLARRILRDFTRCSKIRHPLKGHVAEEVSSYLDYYLARHRDTYLRHIETIRPFVDLIVDGTNTPEEITDEILSYINTRNHYDALIDEINDPVCDPVLLREYMDKWDGEVFIEVLQFSPDKTVLEVGVGTGRLAVRICGKCERFTGIDISPKTIERAKENLRGFNNVSLICGNFLTYQFNERFDIIYSSLTFMHIQNKRAAIQRAAILLNPGGRFVLSIDKNQQMEIDYASGYGSRKIVVYPDTPEEITALITEAGLNIEKQFETEFALIITARKG